MSPSLGEVHGSVAVPRQLSFWRRLFAFSGPAYLVCVGYMDPGNWATDIAGGSQFGYALLWVLLMSNLMAILLQSLSRAARDRAPAGPGPGLPGDVLRARSTCALCVLAEIAIAACDLAEVLGSAIGLQPALRHPAAGRRRASPRSTRCCCWSCQLRHPQDGGVHPRRW